MDSAQQKEKAKQLLKACDAGDVAGVDALIAEDFTFQFMDHSASWAIEGQEISSTLDRKTFLEQGVKAGEFVTRDGFHFQFDLAISEGPHVAIFGTSDATSLKGDRYANTYCWYIGFAGDRICELREYCDTHMAHQILFD